MKLPSVIKNHYQEATMSDYPIKGLIEKIKDTFKRATGKLVSGKTSATRNKVSKSDTTVQAGHDELKDGVKKTV
jgi:hypothetical protein